MTVIFILSALFYPALGLFLTYRYKFFSKIGIILLCYAGGIIIGNTGLFPQSIRSVQNIMSEITVVISLPLLLFSLNVKSWFKIAGKAILSMILATAAVIAVSSAGYLIIKNKYGNAYELSGMAVGVYTGGTPNLAAIKTALNIDSSTYLRFHTYDALFSFLYLIFIFSGAQKLFNRFLPRFKPVNTKNSENIQTTSETENTGKNEYSGMLSLKVLLPLGGALIISFAVIGTAVFISGFFPENSSAAITILLITTISIGLSFVEKIRNINKSFESGMYIIYVFSFVVASMTDVSTLVNIDFSILFFVAFSIFGTLMLHALLAKLFKIDTDTFIVTSVSAICSPPFVPAAAAALKNPSVMLSGITTGIIGYAAGNYLGISLALILQKFF